MCITTYRCLSHDSFSSVRNKHTWLATLDMILHFNDNSYFREQANTIKGFLTNQERLAQDFAVDLTLALTTNHTQGYQAAKYHGQTATKTGGTIARASSRSACQNALLATMCTWERAAQNSIPAWMWQRSRTVAPRAAWNCILMGSEKIIAWNQKSPIPLIGNTISRLRKRQPSPLKRSRWIQIIFAERVHIRWQANPQKKI